MNINPFDLLKNAKEIQGQLDTIKEELKNYKATGSSGGGIVTVTVGGDMQILAIKLDPIAVDPRDIPMLQDLIIAAHKNAMENIKEMMQEKFGPLLNGLDIPGLGL